MLLYHSVVTADRLLILSIVHLGARSDGSRRLEIRVDLATVTEGIFVVIAESKLQTHKVITGNKLIGKVECLEFTRSK